MLGATCGRRNKDWTTVTRNRLANRRHSHCPQPNNRNAKYSRFRSCWRESNKSLDVSVWLIAALGPTESGLHQSRRLASHTPEAEVVVTLRWSFLLRFDARSFLELLFQEPPRSSGSVPVNRIAHPLFRSMKTLSPGGCAAQVKRKKVKGFHSHTQRKPRT